MVNIEKGPFDDLHKIWLQEEETEQLTQLIRIMKASDVKSWLEGNMDTFTFEVQVQFYNKHWKNHPL